MGGKSIRKSGAIAAMSARRFRHHRLLRFRCRARLGRTMAWHVPWNALSICRKRPG